MATPRFNANILTAAKRLHDRRTATSADPLESELRYSIALMTAYQNRAIKDIVQDVYLKYLDQMHLVMPEMLAVSAALTLTTGAVAAPTDCWIILECAKSDFTVYFHLLGTDARLLSLGGKHPHITPSATNPYFYQENVSGVRTLKTLGLTTGDVKVFYVAVPADIAVDGASDIPLNPIWDGSIVNKMVEFGLRDAGSSIPEDEQ
jgi:hypothetical protein